jgi:hypothetical protein
VSDPVPDSIVLTIPTAPGFRGVASLVLGGVGSRLDLPYERMDDLQLAVLSVLESASAAEVTLEMGAVDGSLSLAIGPLTPGVGSDRSLATVLNRLVSGVDEIPRDGAAWLRMQVPREPS